MNDRDVRKVLERHNARFALREEDNSKEDRRLSRFIQEGFISEHTASNLDELSIQLQKWINWHNNHHINRDTRCTPLSSCIPSALRSLDGVHLDDVFCLKEEKKGANA